MKERYLGYLNFLGIPWNLKFLWGPLVDIFGKKRTWMVVMQFAITILTGAISLICFSSANVTNPTFTTSLLVWIFIIMAFISATNDIAIDGYYMEGLSDPKEQAAYTGYRVLAYRLALVLARFCFIALVAFIAKRIAGGNMYTAWGYGFLAASTVMALFSFYNMLLTPDFEKSQKMIGDFKKVTNDFLVSFAAYLEIPKEKAQSTLILGLGSAGLLFVIFFFLKIQPIQAFAYSIIGLLLILIVRSKPVVALSLTFIIFYKIGDEIIFSMGTPFLKRYLLVSNLQLAWLSGLLGLFGAIAGTTLGGLWIKKVGLKRSIWPLTLLMNINILAYVWLAWERPLATSLSGLITIASVYTYEQIAAGLGNAVLIVYILRTCNPNYKAAHYAIGSAFMSIFSTIFGGFGGIIVEKMGYMNLFLLGFFASIPSMLLLFGVKIKDDKK